MHERAVDSAVSLTLASSDCTRSEDRSRACSEPRTNEPLANGSKKSSHFNEASGNVISHTKLRTCPVRKPTVFIVDVESSPAALEFCDGVTTTYMRDHVAGKGHKIIVVYTRSYKRVSNDFLIQICMLLLLLNFVEYGMPTVTIDIQDTSTQECFSYPAGNQRLLDSGFFLCGKSRYLKIDPNSCVSEEAM